jgi:hypothetical protein
MPKFDFNTGSTTRLRAYFKDPDTKEPLDPSIVTFTLRAPDGVVSIFEYGTDAEVIREAEGVYKFFLPLALEGTYRFYFVGETSPNQRIVLVGSVDSTFSVDF